MLATTLSLPEALQCAWHFGCTIPTTHSALLPLHKQNQHQFIRAHIIKGGSSSSSEDDTLLKVFQLIDANKDGLLSLDEVDLYLHKLGLQLSPHAMLALFIGEELADGDGEAVSCLHVDFEGFSRLCESLLGRRHSQEEEEEEEEEDLREVFRLYDRNCDGVISAEEVEMVLGGLGLGNNVKSRKGWERMIRKADTNGDGVLDFTEFKMMMTRNERKIKTLIH